MCRVSIKVFSSHKKATVVTKMGQILEQNLCLVFGKCLICKEILCAAAKYFQNEGTQAFRHAVSLPFFCQSSLILMR